MFRLAASFLLLLSSCAFLAAQTQSHLDPGKVNPDCPNCQQMEQAEPDQPVTKPTIAANVTNKFAHFIPRVLVSNNDSQKIKQVTWQATYIHVTSGETIATYTFVEKRKIAPGKTLLLQQAVFIPVAKLLSHPRVVTVNPGNDAENPRVRQVVSIKEIKYADGTTKTPTPSNGNP
jgi:hypothetical protein